jgi:predicted phosphodiesterase
MPVNKADIARQYRDKYGMDVPTKQLATLMHIQRPKLFTNVENARTALRQIEGKCGNKGNGIKVTHKMEEERPKNPYGLPESYAREPILLDLPVCNNNIGIITDPHFPYQHIPTITEAIRYFKEHRVNTIGLLGDVIDFHGASRFEDDPEKRSTPEEFDAARAFLELLRGQFKNQDIFWIKGNHDIRLEHYLRRNCRILFGDSYFTMEERLRLNDLRIKTYSDKAIVRAGNLGLAHGHHIAKSRGAGSAAKAVWNKAFTDMAIGHLHTPSSNIVTDANGKTFRTYTIGCACERYPDYNPQIAQNFTGFAHVKVKADGSYRFHNYTTDHNGNVIDG